MQPDDTPDFDPEWVVHCLADPDNTDIRDKAADAVRARGTVEVDGKTYRYDAATGGVVEVKAPSKPTTPPKAAPEPKATPKPSRPA